MFFALQSAVGLDDLNLLPRAPDVGRASEQQSGVLGVSTTKKLDRMFAALCEDLAE